MISFELKGQEKSTLDEVDVYLDEVGLNSLIAQLEMIRSGKTDHIHLMAKSWGGNHLDDEVRVASNMPVRHVKMMLVRS
ncbi:immunity protein 32 [Luteimonas sp. XNQY3]|nr:Imm32 family immunity protein [Luteimonas sp. XNQY3]MCD9008214.1 immunity protein 32 [Luteimonas sp. XNQY3]